MSSRRAKIGETAIQHVRSAMQPQLQWLDALRLCLQTHGVVPDIYFHKSSSFRIFCAVPGFETVSTAKLVIER